MHSSVYLTICAASVGGMLFFGTPEMSSMVLVAALAIAVLGVPHGGLDHWTGRRLLKRKFSSRWWMIFFPTYLFVGWLFAVGWYVFPTITVVSFFLVSAWHFGREDQLASLSTVHRSTSHRERDHAIAAAMGGLVIWIPALARPEEMRSLLSLIVPVDDVKTASNIVAITQVMAACLVPIAVVSASAKLMASPKDCRSWVPFATAATAVLAPILISFSIYFCGWHSWQGLQRLRREEALTASQFARCVVPLTVGAILGMVAVGWWMQGASADLLAGSQTTQTLQAVFIGLSVIAVPHLFLHEIDSLIARSRPLFQVYP